MSIFHVVRKQMTASFNKFVDSIYKASYHPNGWGALMMETAGLFDSCAASLQIKTATAVPVIADYGIDRLIAERYEREAPNNDPWVQTIVPVLYRKDIAIASEYVDFEKFKSHDWYNEVYLKLGITDSISTMLKIGDGSFVWLVVNCSEKKLFYSKKEFFLMNRIITHFSRSIFISKCISNFRSREIEFEAALNAARMPMILVKRDLTIAFANAAAEKLLATGFGVRQRRGHFLADDQKAHTALEKASVRPGSAHAPIVVRRADAPPLIIHTSPVGRGFTGDIFARTADSVLILAIVDPGESYRFVSNNLQMTYDLTNAETDIAELLVRGKTIAEIAHTSNRSEGTIRGHLKSIFSKTGIHHQHGLVGLAMRLSSPLYVEN